MKKIFLPFLLIAAITVSAQKVSNKLSFQQGQKLEVTSNINLTSTSMMGESAGNIISIDEYTVATASGPETALQKGTKKIKLNMSAMGRDFAMDSDNPKDLQGPLGEPIKEIMQQKYEFTIDAAGKITAAKEEGKKKKDEGAAGMMAMMMPGMADLSVVPTVGSGSIFKILPEGREVAKGDTWTDSLSENGSSRATVYTVKDITDAEIILDFTHDGTSKTKQAMMGMDIDATSTNKGSGTVTISRSNGLLKQKTATMTTETNMNMGGRDVSSTSKTTAVTTVKPI